MLIEVTEDIRAFLRKCGTSVKRQYEKASSIDVDELIQRVNAYNEEKNLQTWDEKVKAHELVQGSAVLSMDGGGGKSASQGPGGSGLTEIGALRLKMEEKKYQQSIRSLRLKEPFYGRNSGAGWGSVGSSSTMVNKSEAAAAAAAEEALGGGGAGDVLASASKSMSLATNFMVGFVGSFLAGYFGYEVLVDPEGFSGKILSGAFCSFAMLVVESVLFIIWDEKRRWKRERARRKEERKRKAMLGGAGGGSRRPLPPQAASAQPGTESVLKKGGSREEGANEAKGAQDTDVKVAKEELERSSTAALNAVDKEADVKFHVPGSSQHESLGSAVAPPERPAHPAVANQSWSHAHQSTDLTSSLTGNFREAGIGQSGSLGKALEAEKSESQAEGHEMEPGKEGSSGGLRKRVQAQSQTL